MRVLLRKCKHLCYNCCNISACVQSYDDSSYTACCTACCCLQDDDEEDEGSCNLACARTAAKAGRQYDIEGVVGMTCPHVFPAHSLFIKMRTPEMFLYYDHAMRMLEELRPDTRTVYFDLACKYVS